MKSLHRRLKQGWQLKNWMSEIVPGELLQLPSGFSHPFWKDYFSDTFPWTETKFQEMKVSWEYDIVLEYIFIMPLLNLKGLMIILSSQTQDIYGNWDKSNIIKIWCITKATWRHWKLMFINWICHYCWVQRTVKMKD